MKQESIMVGKTTQQQWWITKYGFSSREADVALLAITAMTNMEMAEKLFIEERSVRFQLTNIYKKCGITGKAGKKVELIYLLTGAPYGRHAAENADPI
jgi:DNA-binding CsgD family transcriptional regulator